MRLTLYKRVYRAQGWISAVVRRGGTIVGVRFSRASARVVTLDVELFGRVTPAIRQGIEREADTMGRFLGIRCEPRFSPPR
jgi:hypothetical protein